MVQAGHSLQVIARVAKIPALRGLLGVALIGLTFYAMLQAIGYGLKFFPEPIGSRAALFGEAAGVTLLLTLWSAAFGLLIGVLVGLTKLARSPLVRLPAVFYVWVLRGTPLLVQVLFVYLALPEVLKAAFVPLGWLSKDWSGLPDFWSGVLALSLNVGAYNAEIVRGAVLSIPSGQSEAARSLGLGSTQTMLEIVLPQGLRVALPPLVNNLVSLLKDSSQVSVIGVLELLLQTQRVSSETFLPLPILSTTAGIYLTMTTVMTLFTNALERRFQGSGRR